MKKLLLVICEHFTQWGPIEPRLTVVLRLVRLAPHLGFSICASLAFMPTFCSGAQAGALDLELLYAAKGGNVSNVESCLARGANANFLDEAPRDNGWAGFSPLSITIDGPQSLECARVLLAAGADPLQYYKSSPWLFGLAVASKETTTNRAILSLVLDHIREIQTNSEDRVMEYVFYPLVHLGDAKSLTRLKGLGGQLGGGIWSY